LVLKDLVGLDDSHGEIVGGKLFDVAKPEKVVLAFSFGGGGITGVVTVPERLPTAHDKAHRTSFFPLNNKPLLLAQKCSHTRYQLQLLQILARK